MRRFKFGVLPMLILTAITGANAQSFISHLYFPGIVGARLPVKKQGFDYNNGMSINTAIEYRPDDHKHVFYRFDFDGASAKYKVAINNLPVNVVNGTLHINSFVAGAGYRYKQKNIGFYFLLQPGLGVNSFNRVSGLNNGYAIEQINVSQFQVKYSAGVEYYIAEHFALVFEPAYYQNNFGNYTGLPSISQFSLNIGFTTTLF